jgi:hypothetical protein
MGDVKVKAPSQNAIRWLPKYDVEAGISPAYIHAWLRASQTHAESM